MKGIIPVKGKVKYTITLDPGVWIFDDRRIDLDTYFDLHEQSEDEELAYIENTAKHWEREIREGAVFPPTLKTERKFEKEKILTGSFGMNLAPFLQNASPTEDASKVIFQTTSGNVEVPMEKAKQAILAFSLNGKPLKEDGPVHVYYQDGSNRKDPIKNVEAIVVE
ncbi:peptidyl-prolyl cis-trans isomerase [Bacillus sp. FJAT-47783]|uniref:peptidyl-prolyl cis-trans isomerase n=1 Tax=Bacillus sp. FJAT-47783 TaxID=2922712 RepID=UPI001FAE6317|nr:peptidyl-prolyl cis-trans isomerase [Bacillus sp. FJAT-47783]